MAQADNHGAPPGAAGAGPSPPQTVAPRPLATTDPNPQAATPVNGDIKWIPIIEVATPSGIRRLAMTGLPVIFGRDRACSMAIEDKKLSPFHCVLEFEGSKVVLRDLQSKKGTRLNGKRVKKAFLQAGDLIEAGPIEIRFTMKGTRNKPINGSAHAPTQVKKVETVQPGTLQRKQPVGPTIVAPPSPTESQPIPVATPAPQQPERTPEPTAPEPTALEPPAPTPVQPPSNVPATPPAHEPAAIDEITLPPELLEDLPQVADTPTGFFQEVINRETSEGTVNESLNDIVSDVLGESVPPDVHDVPELKLADDSRATTTLGELNLESWMERDLSVALQGQTGLLLVAGPPASGRSTTVSTIVESLNNNARKVVTLDDHLAGNLNATAKLPEASLRDDSFPTVLHSVLGNEAGIVVVGELTNATTTSMAMRIARGGHLVISTIESRDAIGTILKLLEMNIEPQLIASSLQFVLAQRMARLLCPKCKRPRALSPWEMPLLADVCGGNAQLNDPVGCGECGNTGYNDQRAIFEMLAIGDGLRHTILRTPQPHEVHATARACAYTSLIDTGYRLVAEGVTSMEEIEKVMAQGK